MGCLRFCACLPSCTWFPVVLRLSLVVYGAFRGLRPSRPRHGLRPHTPGRGRARPLRPQSGFAGDRACVLPPDRPTRRWRGPTSPPESLALARSPDGPSAGVGLSVEAGAVCGMGSPSGVGAVCGGELKPSGAAGSVSTHPGRARAQPFQGWEAAEPPAGGVGAEPLPGSRGAEPPETPYGTEADRPCRGRQGRSPRETPYTTGEKRRTCRARGSGTCRDRAKQSPLPGSRGTASCGGRDGQSPAGIEGTPPGSRGAPPGPRGAEPRAAEGLSPGPRREDPYSTQATAACRPVTPSRR
jgi:hypothetical protein